MNGRASRRRRKELVRARAAGETPQLDTGTQDLVLRLRLVRDQRLADNGRRRRADLEAIESYFATERREIWSQFHEIMQAIRDGQRVVLPEAQVVEAKLEKLTLLGRLRRRFFAREAPLPEIASS